MHSLKAAIVNKEINQKKDKLVDSGLSQTLGSNTQAAMIF